MKSLLLPLLVITSGMAPSHAAVIFSNEISGPSPGFEILYTTDQIVHPLISVSGITAGTGTSGNIANDRFTRTGWNSIALDSADYFSFSLTAAAGHSINFESFVYTAQASPTGPTLFSFRSSIGGFEAGGLGTPSATETTIDLSAPAFQGVENVEFRLYAWGASGGGGTLSINDFAFNGSVIPEPSTLIIGCFGMLGLLGHRRVSRP